MKNSIKQSTLTLILNSTSIILIILSIIAFYFIVRTNRDVDTANRNRYELTANAKRFMEGSAYLTNEVRAFAATSNKTHYDNYWNEVNLLKNRDIGVHRMLAIGITDEERVLVETMFSLSNKLIPLEDRAMRLAENGDTQAALQAVYGPSYLNWITNIRGVQTLFIDTLNSRTENELLEKQRLTAFWTSVTVVCLAVTALIQIISTLMIRHKVIRPLVSVRDEMLKIAQGNLHSEFNAEPDTSELGMLISSIHTTKAALNSYIDDISKKLSAMAGGDFEARIRREYIGDFQEIKRSVNRIAERLAEQRARDEKSREELRQAYEAANQANRAKTDFLANMSHEIRTPMNAIVGMAELLSGETLTEQQRSYVRDIKTASTSLLRIINDILDISKISTGKFQLIPVDYDLPALLENINSIFSYEMRKRGLAFKLDITPDTPKYLFGDDIRLRQCLVNLLGNAMKFTKKGGVTLTVGREGEKVRFSVIDTGIGIKEEDISRIYEKFSQFDMSKNRSVSGTGLGLSITKALIDQMGGTIVIESQYGHGTAFHALIPLVAGNPDNINVFDEVNCHISAPTAHILVVDDNELNLHVASGLLKRCDILCDTAQSGFAAIEMAKGKKYDIIFMDHMMPDFDGVETTRILRQYFDRDEQVIIALTANAVEGTKEMLMEEGMNDFISKPINSDELSQMLRKWLPPDKVEESPNPRPAHD